MYCSNCGKELKDGEQFCPSCGMRADAAKTREEGANEWANLSGIEVREDFDEISCLAGKVRKGERRWNMIGKVLAVLGLILMARVILRDVPQIIDGEMGAGYLIAEIMGCVFAGCVLVAAFLDIVLPFVDAKKSVLSDEYLKLISVSDNCALMKAAGEMRCSAVKSAYMDENGNVRIQGKRCKHTFQKNEEGSLVLVSGKDNYKTVLEKEAIAGCLLKFLSPGAPVNAYENERYNARLSKMNRILAVIATISCTIMIFCAIQPGLMEGTGKYVRMVREGHPAAYPDISYGDAFDDFFENENWKYFQSDDGRDVVEFRGNCFADGETKDIIMQFLLSVDDGTFDLHAVSIDGEPQAELVNGMFVLAIFERYGSGDGMGTLPDEEEEDGADEALSEPSETKPQKESEQEEEDDARQQAAGASDLFYPIMYEGYADGYNPCPVMVNDEVSGNPKYGSYGEMLASLVDDSSVMYAPPAMQDGKIYTATRWDAPEMDWYNGLLTQDQFLTIIFWLETLHEEKGFTDISTGGSWEDVSALAGRWDGDGMEIAISIYSDFSYCPAYSEIGNLVFGEDRATAYMIGKAGSDVYVSFLFEDGQEMLLCYSEDGTAQAWGVSEGCLIDEGTQFVCVERFES